MQSTEVERLSGFCDTLEEAGVQIRPEQLVEKAFDSQVAFDHIADLLRAGRVEFTAVVCADDLIAYGVISAVREHGLDVPRDISVVGYDDIPAARHIGLTTVRQPAFEMGRSAMLALEDLLSGGVASVRSPVLDPSLVIRSTCAQAAIS